MFEELETTRTGAPEVDVVALMEKRRPGVLRRYKKGSVLYRDQDLAKEIFIIRKGYVKVFIDSSEGRLHTNSIRGAGRMVGVTGYLLSGRHESIAEVFEDSEIYTVPSQEFGELLMRDKLFAISVMCELARMSRSFANQVRDLSMLDVQRRIMYSLVRLANEHGKATDRGVKIGFKLTHEELSDIVAANRTTISAYLSELKRQGYLWKEASHFVIIPPEHLVILDGLSQSVLEANDQLAIMWAKRAAEEGVNPFKSLDALTEALRQVAGALDRGKIDLPDVAGAAFAVKTVLPFIERQIRKASIEIPTQGTVVIGAVRGDIHDIGKTIAATLLVSAGFDVVDLGVDVGPEQFIAAVDQHDADILALSATMSVTAPQQATVIDALKREGMRDRVRVMVGGAGVTGKFAASVQADGYEPTAQGAVELASQLIARRHRQ